MSTHAIVLYIGIVAAEAGSMSPPGGLSPYHSDDENYEEEEEEAEEVR